MRQKSVKTLRNLDFFLTHFAEFLKNIICSCKHKNTYLLIFAEKGNEFATKHRCH